MRTNIWYHEYDIKAKLLSSILWIKNYLSMANTKKKRGEYMKNEIMLFEDQTIKLEVSI